MSDAGRRILTLIVGSLLFGSIAMAQGGGGTLRIGLNSEPITLNPAITNNQIDVFVSAKVYEGLIYVDEDMNPVPGLARSWEVSDDGLTITLQLQQGVRWHDGVPFTSADVKFSLEDVVKTKHPLGPSQLAVLESVETPDDETAILHLSGPSIFFASPYLALNASTAPIIPKHLFEGTDIATNPVSSNPVGTGPFRFEEWVRGSHIVLVRNDDYWAAGLPLLDQVVYLVIPDASTRLLAFENGEIDYLPFGVPYSALGRLGARPDVDVIRFRDTRYQIHGLYFNVRNEPFSNPLVRQAIAHAIDKQAIVDNVTFGYDRVANSIQQSGSVFYNPGVPTYDLDLTTAAALLDQAGLTPGANGIRFETVFTVDLGAGETALKTAELLRDQLAKVGIALKIVPLERATFLQTVYQNYDFEVATFYGTMGPDPSVGSKWFVTPSAPASFVNPTGYSNPKIDDLLGEFAVQTDQNRRRELFNEAQDILLTDLPYIPIREDSWPVLVSSRFTGVATDMFAGKADRLLNAARR